MRFLRSKKLRGILYRAADGKCQVCGCSLPEDWHADHIVPWCHTGETNVHEMQALCPQCNLKKGKTMENELRKWQTEAWKRCERAERDFFVEATPGAGKTTFGCHIAKKKLDYGVAARVIIVVPTTALKSQWVTALHKYNIDAEHRYKGGGWPEDFDAICVTYHQVANDAGMLAYFCNQKATVVILDEVHHCGDEAHWGKAIQSAFSDAVFRLSLSGTPFRSDGNKIPFLVYKDGKAQPDFTYGYGDGLQDGICRHIFFPRQGGTMEWSSPQGELKRATFDDVLKESEASQRLRTALTTGEWLGQTIVEANASLNEMRANDPDAAGLVIAIDQIHANKVRRMVMQLTGVEPVCVSSDDPDSHTKIESFRESSQPWIVAVKMVSEGVDIPRLRIGVYATMYRTEMFFRQAVGRFVRVEQNHDDPTAMVYIPDDPTLRAYAEEIRMQRVHELEQELKDEKERQERADGVEDHDSSMFMPLSSEAENMGTIVSDYTFSPEELARAADVSVGLQCRPEIAAMILRRAGNTPAPVVQPKPEKRSPRKTDEKQRLKTINSKLVRAIAFKTGREYAHINADLNREVGIRSITEATIEQLHNRICAAEAIARQVGAQL